MGAENETLSNWRDAVYHRKTFCQTMINVFTCTVCKKTRCYTEKKMFTYEYKLLGYDSYKGND